MLMSVEGATPVECARCGAVCGTLADVRKLALHRVNIFEYPSRENLQ
jgi:LSD1 subclass zinc finger protein